MKLFSLLLALFLCCGLLLAGPAWAEADTAPDTAPEASAKPRKAVRKPSAKRKAARTPRTAAKPDAAELAAATENYKKELAQRVTEANPERVYPGRPQALLRSVVVLQFTVDAQGKLKSSRVRRSNGDAEAEHTALASLRAGAPLPKPPSRLLRGGRLELHETWLFNNDGRFQIRSIAQEQVNQ